MNHRRRASGSRAFQNEAGFGLVESFLDAGGGRRQKTIPRVKPDGYLLHFCPYQPIATIFDLDMDHVRAAADPTRMLNHSAFLTPRACSQAGLIRTSGVDRTALTMDVAESPPNRFCMRRTTG